jgi:hypothetical protein
LKWNISAAAAAKKAQKLRKQNGKLNESSQKSLQMLLSAATNTGERGKKNFFCTSVCAKSRREKLFPFNE